MKNNHEGVTIQCPACKKRAIIPFARAADDLPVCQYCLLPMVVVEANKGSKP